MEVTPNWLEMPHEIIGMILQRLGALEILKNAQKVCTTWRRICKDPAMWKLIDINHHFLTCDTDVIEKLTKQALHRSCGELMDIRLQRFGTDDLLDYISRRSSKLHSLCLSKCYSITGSGLIHALKRLPHLETLDLFYINVYADDIKVIGQSCPKLNSFKMRTRFMECDGDSMPALRHLQLVGSTLDNDDGVRAILNGCPHLESLDLRGCFYLRLEKNLEKLCRERIKDFKFNRDKVPYHYGESDMDSTDYDINDLYDAIDLPEDDDMDDCGISGIRGDM